MEKVRFGILQDLIKSNRDQELGGVLIINKPKEPKSISADTGMIVIVGDVELRLVGDGVGSQDDVGSREALEKAIESKEAIDSLVLVGQAENYEDFIINIDSYIKTVFTRFRDKGSGILTPEYYIAVTLVITNHNEKVKKTVVIQIGDTLVFNESGDVIIPPDNCLEVLARLITLEQIDKKLLTLSNLNLQPSSLADQWFESLNPEALDYIDELLNGIIAQINMSIVQISSDDSATMDDLKQELVRRGLDLNNSNIQAILKILSSPEVITKLNKEYKKNYPSRFPEINFCPNILVFYSCFNHILANCVKSLSYSISYQLYQLPYSQPIFLASDGIEKGGKLKKFTSTTANFHHLIPALLADKESWLYLGEYGGTKKDDICIVMSISLNLLEWMMAYELREDPTSDNLGKRL